MLLEEGGRDRLQSLSDNHFVNADVAELASNVLQIVSRETIN